MGCLQSRNEYQLEYILDELNVCSDKPQNCLMGSSIFETVLTIPNTKRLIEMCIYHGSDFYQVLHIHS